MSPRRFPLLSFSTALLALSSAPLPAQSVAAARIEGSVLDHAGAPVRNARVRAVREGFRIPGLPARYESVSAASGAFSVAGLPPGTYRLCVRVEGQALLDPCLWPGAAAAAVAVAPGQKVTGRGIRLARPMPLSIRVDDPRNLLAAERSGGAHLLVGVWAGNGLFHSARLASQDNRSRTYSLVLPAATTARLTLNGHNLTVRDTAAPAGKPAPGASPQVATMDVNIPAAETAGRTVSFQIAAP